MPSMTLTPYNSFFADLLKAGINLQSDTIKVALIAGTYTPDVDAHDCWDDVSAHEVSGAGYATATLAGKTVTQNNTDNRGDWLANDVVWSSITVTYRWAVLYKDTGVASTSPLIGYLDPGSTRVVSGDDVKLDWDAVRILSLQSI